MNTHRIEVFNGTDDDDVVFLVPHHFKLILFPPDHRLLHKHLVDRAELQSLLKEFTIFFNVICNPSSCTPQSECRPEDDRKTKMLYNIKSVLDGGYCCALRDFQSDVPHCLFKQLPVFSFPDRMQLRTYQLHLVAVQHT